VDKSSDAFRTISEVADDLDLPQHVLRFWETRFAQIKPMKRGGGRRYYRPDDVDLLKGIRRLLYSEGYTIKGVQRILKDQGVRAVVTLGQGNGALDAAARARLGAGAGEGDFGPGDDGFGDVAFVSVDETDARGADAEAGSTQGVEAPPERDERYSPERMARRFAPDARTVPTPAALTERSAQVRREPDFDEPKQPTRSTFAPVIDRFRGVANRLSGEATEEPTGQRGLSRDELRRLQATLFELLECKRLLDQTR
jgi:DNA-binding transcriptional MerR regulator